MKNHETDQAIRHVLWHSGDRVNGFEPGGFTIALLDAWVRADRANSARLAIAFPELGHAVAVAREYGSEELAKFLA